MGYVRRGADDDDTMRGGAQSKPLFRTVLLTCVAALACASLSILPDSPADAATSGRCYSAPSKTCRPSMSTTWTPWVSPTRKGSTSNWSVKSGTAVDMRCWTTGASQLGTSKWFKIKSTKYPFTTGYVPANAVKEQISVGRC